MLIYVKSEAANRVMKSFSNYLEKKLKLEVNASKSKVARPDEVKYLGFGFTKLDRLRSSVKLSCNQLFLDVFKVVDHTLPGLVSTAD